MKKDNIIIYLNIIIKLLNKIDLREEIWIDYLNKIKNDFIELATYNKDTDNFVKELFKPDSGLTRLASILWWSKQSDLKSYMNNMNNIIDHLIIVSDLFFEQLGLFEEKIIMPPHQFNQTTDYYDSFTFKTSIIRKLFPKINICDKVMCEIYQLARNNAKGKCYLS